jgi:hypothetical protein
MTTCLDDTNAKREGALLFVVDIVGSGPILGHAHQASSGEEVRQATETQDTRKKKKRKRRNK